MLTDMEKNGDSVKGKNSDGFGITQNKAVSICPSVTPQHRASHVTWLHLNVLIHNVGVATPYLAIHPEYYIIHHFQST